MDAKIDFGPGRIVTSPARSDTGADAGTSQRRHEGARVTAFDSKVQDVRRELNFRVDETTGITVVRVVDADTGTLVRQIPSRSVLEMMKEIDTMQANHAMRLNERA